MALLTKDDIIKADDRKKKLVKVPEWGGEVYVRVMSGTDRDKFESNAIQNGRLNPENIRAKLAALTICDENGDLIFSDADVEELGKKSSAALTRVFNAAQKLNLMSDDDVRELTKN